MEERHPPLLWQLVMLLASAMTVATLALSISIQLPPDIESMLRWADTAVCGIFFLDFLVLFRLARDKRKYLITWGWIDLLSSVPLIPALQLGRLARMLRILRLMRGLKSAATLAGITMIMGIAIFGSLTAVITSLVLEPAKEANDPILAKLEKIEAELTKLRSRLEES